MKRRFTKTLVSMLLLVAMLTQNAYGVYASEPGFDASETEVQTPDIIVETSDDYTESADEVVPSDDSYSDELVEETTDVYDETADDEGLVEETPEVSDSESLEVLSTQISGSGLDSVELYVDTNRLNTGDTFRIIFTGPADARYDTRLNDNLDTNAQGIYRFLDLNNEGFNIRATSNDNVTFEYGYNDGIPSIKVISVDTDADKMLYTKSIQTKDGKPATAVFGEGYTNISISLDTTKLDARASYSVYVDSEANVTVNGSEASSISCTKETESIDLSNLDKKQFTVYIVENEGSEVSVDASVESVEDGKAIFYVSGEETRTKRVYTYSDDDVTVTATLQYANAVPDDAEFVVTPVVSAGLVNAYIDALNKSDDGMAYTSENTLLYDVAFLVDKTDEDGNVIPGEKVEYEPEAGSVTIDIKFTKSQLTDELGAVKSEDITVNHLPLKDAVKDAVDKTLDATDIDASDIIVESVNADISVKEDGTDEITLSVDSLSILSVTNGKPVVPGNNVTFEDVLGEAKNYGIVANQMTLAGHMETNFAVGSMHGNADIQGPKNEGKSAGTTYIGAYDGNNFKMTMNGNSGTLLIYTTYAAVKNFGFNMTGYNPGQFPASNARPSFPDNVVVNYNKYDASYIQSMVSGMVNRVYTNSDALFAEDKAIAFSDFKLNGANYPVIDIASVNKTPGTYYINFRPGEYTGQHFVINITADQNIVFNIPDQEVAFGQYEITIGGKNYGSTQGNANEDIICQKIIFNCPNAKYAHTVGPCAGTFVCPKADFETDSVAAGWLVCNNVKRVGGNEWHCVYHNLPDPVYNPTSLTLGVEKELKNILANEEEPFNFVLYQTDNMYYSDDKNHGTQKKPVKLDEITISSYDANHKGKMNFKPIEYKAEGTYYYVIREDMQGDQSMNWAATNGCYAHVEVVVKKEYDQSTRTTTYYVDSVRYSYGMTSSRTLENPVNLNKNNAVITFINEKHKTTTGLTIPVTKIMQNTSGTELPTWPIDETFNFKIEPMTQTEAGKANNVSDNPPMPSAVTISVDNAHKTAEFVWPEGSFTYTEDLTPGISSYVRDTEEKAYGSLVDGATVYPRCYMYKVTEIIPNPKTEGVTYDTNVQYVKVWHNSCKLGSLRWVEISVNGSRNLNYCGGTLNKIEFINKYEAPKGAIKVTKSVKAGAIDYDTNETFYFIIKKNNEQIGGVRPVKAKETVTISDLALGTYTVIETDKNGTPVSELESFKYEASVDRQSVEVKAGQTAQTVPLVTITNKIGIEPASITIDGVKKVDVTQYNIKDAKFRFILEASSGAPMPAAASEAEKSAGKMTVTNKGSNFNFGTINFTKDDIGKTYTYKITEDVINDEGFAENTEAYTVKVAVTQSGNKTVATKTILKGSKDVTNDGITFTNKYTSKKSISFEAKKTISGRNLLEKEFSFVLEGTNENAIAKMPGDAKDGKLVKNNTLSNTNEELISFGGVEFTQRDLGKGSFTYRITEPGVDGNGLVYDKTVYDIKVTPKLDENNNLVLEKSVTKTVNHTTSDAAGYIKADGNICVLFNNIYDSEGDVSFAFSKTVEGDVPETASFSFDLYKKTDAGDVKIDSKTVTGPFPKGFVFKDIEGLKFKTSDIGKTYNYYAVEVIPEGAKKNADGNYELNGIVYSSTVHNFSVTVKDAGNGKLGFDIMKDGKKYEVGTELGTFTNKYTTASVEVPVNGKKVLPGKEIKKDDYTFRIEAVEAVDANGTAIAKADMPMPASAETTVQNAEGNFSFGKIEFTKAGTYTYKVTEVEPEENKQAGVTYDQDYYTVIIKIKDNRAGKLVQDGKTIVKRAGETEIAELNILNTYEAEGTVVLEAQKTVNGGNYAVREGAFVFGIYTDDQGTKLINPDTNEPYTAVNDAAGNVSFAPIKYVYDDVKESEGKTRTYTYYIHELSTKDELKDYDGDKDAQILPGYTYDTGYYPVTVTVSDDGTGKLQITKDYSANQGGKIVVDNEYSAKGSTVIYGRKAIQGRAITADDSFIFTLISNADNSVVDTVEVDGSKLVDGKIEFQFKTLEYTAPGEYFYTVKELVPAVRNQNMIYDSTTYTVKVIVTDNHDGTLNAVPDKGTVDVPVSFLNKVPTAKGVDLMAYKALAGRDLKAGEFEFTLKEVGTDGKLTDLQKKENEAAKAGDSATVAFDGISYEMKDAGTHVYEIAEVIPGSAKLVEMEVDGQIVSKYVYKGITYDETKFYAVVNVSVNEAGDSVVVDGPHYHKGSKDGAVVDAPSVKFNNKYAGKTEAYFEGEKHLYRNTVDNGILFIGGTEISIPDTMVFSFILRDADGKELQRVNNDGKKFEFAPITYTAEDLKDENKIGDNQYMIRYTIEEVYRGKTIAGVTYDDKIYDCAVVLSVGKNGDLKAEKRVIERTSDEETTAGIWNKLKAFISGNDDLIRFNNIYRAKAKVKLGVTKTLTGMDWGDATSFDFQIKKGANVVTQAYYGESETVTVTKDTENHTAYFTELEFDIDDLYTIDHHGSREFTYKIKELEPDNPIPGVTYDTKERTVDIKISDAAHNGKLVIEYIKIDGVEVNANASENEDGVLVGEPNPIGITNSYIPKKTSAKIEGLKVLTGRTLAEGEFAFTLKAETEGAPLPESLTVTNKADGTFEFAEMEYGPELLLGANGIYIPSKEFVYTVTENVPEGATTITVDGKEYKVKDGITYDATPKTVTVTVVNEGGELKATVSPDKVGLQFTNSFDNENSASLSAKKIVVGTSAADKEFAFTLKSTTASDPNRAGKSADENGNVLLDTKIAKNGDTVTFETLNYTLQKTLEDAKSQGRTDRTAVYTYEIEETQTTIDGYTMSKQLYTATVTVSADEATGALTVTKKVVMTKNVDGTLTNSDASVDGELAVFTNQYDAEGFTSVAITKTLEGRSLKDGEFTFYLKDKDGAVLDTKTSYASPMTDKKAENIFTFGGEKTYLHYTVEDLKNGESYAENKILYYTIEEDVPEDAETVEINGKNFKKKGSVIYDNRVYVVAVFINNPGTGVLEVNRICHNFESDRAAALSSMEQYVNAKWDSQKSFAKNVDALKNADEPVSFVNEYKAVGEWDPRGKKILTGMPLEKDKMFNFTLSEFEVKDGVATDKVINQATGYNGGKNHEKVVFDKSDISFLEYDLDDVGLHVYKITEVLPVKADKDGKVVQNGITYDTKEWTFHVTVTDNGDGTLNVECPEDTETGDVFFTFNNHYNAEGFIDLYGAKVLEGSDFDSVEIFSFSIKEVTEGKESQEYTVNNDNSMISFDHTEIPVLNYAIKDDDRTAVGNHYYEIRETSKSANGVTCDTKVYRVTVKVSDNGDGTLSSEVTSSKIVLNEGAAETGFDFSFNQDISKWLCFSFVNKYEAKAEILFEGVKHLRNAELSTEDIVKPAELAGKYNFSIYEYKSAEERANGTNGKLVSTTSCGGDGKYKLIGPKYTQDVLKETAEGKTGYKNSAEFFYQIVEVKPTEGEWDETKTIFTGNNGVIYDNRVYNVDVTVKAAMRGSDKLQVEVRDHDSQAVISATPDANNVYTIGDTDAQRASRPEGIGFFDFKNIKPEFTRVSGNKTWNDGGVDPASRPDVYIDLKSSEDDYKTVIDTYVIKAPATTYAFEKLPATNKFGKKIEYKVSERPIEGYYSEQVGDDFINTKGDILIRKISSDTGLPLEGAVLAILDSTGKEVERWTSASSAHKVEAKLTPGATYTLHEVSAPTGYQVAADKTFTAPTKGGDIVVTMEDPRIIGNVRLIKLDASTRDRLAGAEFALYTEGGDRVYASGTPGSYTYSTTSSNGRFAVNSSGELYIAGLPYGTYYFTELSAPAGYRVSSDRVGFTILENEVTVEVTFLNTKETGSVRLRKTNADGSVPLAGAVFELYAKSPSSASVAVASTIYSDVYYRVGTYTTDASGTIYVGDLPWDDYYFVEVQAPAGYQITRDVNGDDIAYTFTVGSSGTTELTYDLGRITNQSTPPGGGEVRGERRDDGRRNGGVLSGVLGVRAAPKRGVLGERLGPVTGDATNIILWLLLLLASVGAIVGVAVANSKRKKAAK